MSRPVQNWRRSIAGAEVYPDLDELELFFVAPKPRWIDLRETVGPQLAILHGEVVFNLTEQEKQALLAALPGKRIGELMPSSVAGAVQVAIDVRPPHACLVKVIQSVPFPKLSIDATLRPTSPDYQQTLDAIRAGYRSSTLLRGPLTFTASMAEAAIAVDVLLKWIDIHDAVFSELRAQVVPQSTAMRAVRVAVQRLSPQLVRPHPGMTVIPDSVIWFIEERVFQRLFLRVEDLERFDDGSTIAGQRLRDKNELVAEEKVRLMKTRPVDLEQILVN